MSDVRPPAPVTRRTFVVGGSAVLGTAALAAWAARVAPTNAPTVATAASAVAPSGPAHHAAASTRSVAVHADALAATAGSGFVEPAVRTSHDGVLATTLRVASTPVVIGSEAVDTVTYEGTYPGPTLAVRAGDTLKVTLVNDGTEPTNLHMHGFHVSPSGRSDNVLLTIDAGTTFEYEYDIPDDHPAGTYWYHSHQHGYSDDQVFAGLFGLVVMGGDLDEVPGVAGVPERVMVMSQTDVVDGAIVPGGDSPVRDQATLINGQYQPVLDITEGEVQRWRICNAASTFYRLRLGGQPLHVVNVDGNTPAETVVADVVIIPPGGRVDVLVRGGVVGESTFETISWSDLGPFYPPNMVSAPQTVLHLRTVTADEPARDSTLPTELLPWTDLRTVAVDRRRTLRLQEREPRGVGPNDAFRYFIDGAEFDHDVVNQTMVLGTTEEWEIVNETYEPHPFHIHVNPFQVIAIGGEPSGERFLRDSALVPPFSSIVIRHRFLDYTGRYVLHCHILFHEDHGMMQLLEVVE